MSFCDKDRLSRFAAGIKERYMRKADYDSDQSIIKAGGIEKFFEPDFEKIFNITFATGMYIGVSHLVIDITLKGSGWSSSAPYTQTINGLTGVTSKATVGNPTVVLDSANINVEDIVKYQNALGNIKAIITNDDGSITFIAPHIVNNKIDLPLSVPIAINDNILKDFFEPGG